MIERSYHHASREVDLTPTPAAYEKMLNLIIMNARSYENREWAEHELERIQPAVRLGKWIT